MKKPVFLTNFLLKLVAFIFTLAFLISLLEPVTQLFTFKQSSPSQLEKSNQIAVANDNTSVEKLVSEFKFIEGPVWHPSGFLLFSDIPGNTIYQWAPNKPLKVFRRPSGKANGNTLDKHGRLITAEHENRRVSRTLDDDTVITLVSRYEGKRLNSPNDLVVRSDGSIYFTDPPFGIQKEQEELGFYGVYQLKPNGQLKLLVKDFVRPNGLVFSADEKNLYVNDSQVGNIRVFDVQSDGSLTNGRIFADMKDPSQVGVPDGMKVDVQGNVYSTGPGGVWIFSPQGQLKSKILVPEMATNLAWGDQDYKTLYITASKSLYRIRLEVAGVQPGKSPLKAN